MVSHIDETVQHVCFVRPTEFVIDNELV